MTDKSHPSPPDPWAQARRIAAAWQEMGRGVDRRTQVARMEAVRATRTKGVAEARTVRLQEVIDKAVAEALQNLRQGAAAVSESTPDVPEAPAVPEKPFHEMTTEEFRAAATTAWGRRGASMRSPGRQSRRPMTISELIAGQYGEDGA
ncbi:hypothetical protein OG747_39930 [Streptomyces sp. NBC_01384]|uniref:hypothetical protein n=1 Tax=Streptomyces sp. NBC_01384 TaxID=2903847 RepID=UPI00324BF88F